MLSNFDKQGTSECDVQVRLCMALSKAGYQWKTEVKLSSKELDGARGCRFDVVVYEDNKPIAIVEVKKEHNRARVEPKKCNYYRKVTGLPVLHCAGYEGIEEVLGGLL